MHGLNVWYSERVSVGFRPLHVLQHVNTVRVEISKSLFDSQPKLGRVEFAPVVEVGHGHFDDVMNVVPLWMILQNLSNSPASLVFIAGVDEVDPPFESPFQGLLAHP